jgi:hypothetical protein
MWETPLDRLPSVGQKPVFFEENGDSSRITTFKRCNEHSFPRSPWECRPRRSASSAKALAWDAERPGLHSHAERGNEDKSLTLKG